MKKADEMEMAINYRAARCGFFFLEIALLGYIIYYVRDDRATPFCSFNYVLRRRRSILFMKIYATHG
jgi:hypothetical protein